MIGTLTICRDRPHARPATGRRASVLLAVGLLAAAIAPGVAAAADDARGERPFQIQFDFVGLHVGYHLTETFYLGLTHQFGYKGYIGTDNDPDDEVPVYGQQGADDVDTDIGSRSALELRISPWEPGFYFALAALHVEASEQEVRWDERGRRVGRGDYVTDLEADIKGHDVTTPAVGLGFNHVFDVGLSVGAGILLGLIQPEEPDVEVRASNPAVTDEDLARFRRDVRERFPDTPFMLHLAIGYNF